MSIFALAGRKGGHARAARYDGLEVTAKARATFADSFSNGHGCLACGPRVEIPVDLPASERQRRADSLRKQHYAALALRRVQKKAARRRVNAEAANEDRDADGTSTRP